MPAITASAQLICQHIAHHAQFLALAGFLRRQNRLAVFRVAIVRLLLFRRVAAEM